MVQTKTFPSDHIIIFKIQGCLDISYPDSSSTFPCTLPMGLRPEDDDNSPNDHEVSETESAGAPHMALFLVVPYLSLSELLSVAQVCVSFRDAVNEDVLPWLELTVGDTLGRRLTGEMLLKITAKAGGKLRTLGLSSCTKISDDALLAVITSNPSLEKLDLTGCTGLTPEGIINAAKALSLKGSGLKFLKVHGVYNLHKGHLQTLRLLIEQNGESDQGIDVEVCPRCNEVRAVFWCPREICKRGGKNNMKECRGCAFCIPRCVECRRCVELDEVEEAEAICADVLCLGCWSELPKCSFCNRPYCRQHSKQPPARPSEMACSGFICDSCNAPHNHEDSDFM